MTHWDPQYSSSELEWENPIQGYKHNQLSLVEASAVIMQQYWCCVETRHMFIEHKMCFHAPGLNLKNAFATTLIYRYDLQHERHYNRNIMLFYWRNKRHRLKTHFTPFCSRWILDHVLSPNCINRVKWPTFCKLLIVFSENPWKTWMHISIFKKEKLLEYKTLILMPCCASVLFTRFSVVSDLFLTIR